jgi:hypothetical protein
MRRLLGFAALALLGACAPENFNFDFSGFLKRPPHGETRTQDAEMTAKLVTKEQLLSVLESVFGTLSPGARDLALNNSAVLGGAEDYYERGSLAAMRASNSPISMSAREALRLRLCHQVARNDTHVREAVARLSGLSGGALTTKLAAGPDDVDLTQAYQLFFPGDEPSEDVVTALRDIGEEAQVSIPMSGGLNEAWRFVLLTLCIDPAWQRL